MITKRGVKGSALSDEEVDANWDALAPKITSVSGNTTLNDTHYTVLVNAVAGAAVIALPSAASAFSGGVGRVYNVKKIDASANTVTVDGSGAETIDGAATQVLTAQWQSMTVQSNGATWNVTYKASAGGGEGGALLDAAQSFTKAQVVAPVALTPGATVAPDSEASNNFSLTADQSFTLANAANPAAARAMNIEIIQDATGSRVMTLDTEYLFAADADKVLSTAASAVDYLSCVRNAANTAWLCSLAKAFS